VHVRAHSDSGDDNGGGNDAVELDGAILTLDAAHQTLTMRGPTTVSYATATFAGGKATDLAVGSVIQVQGNLAANGAQVIADKITFGH
jgi:hypothetical protein